MLRFVHLWDWGLRLRLKKYVILDVDRSLGFCRDFSGMALVAFFSMLFIVRFSFDNSCDECLLAGKGVTIR